MSLCIPINESDNHGLFTADYIDMLLFAFKHTVHACNSERNTIIWILLHLWR